MPDPEALILIGAAIAFVLLGAFVRRWWVLIVPVLLGVVLFVATADDDALAGLGAIIATVLALAATAVGVALGRAHRRRAVR